MFAGQLFPVEEATPFFQNAETRLLKPLPPLVLSIEGSLGVSLFDFTQDSTQRYNYLDSNTHASFQVFFGMFYVVYGFIAIFSVHRVPLQQIWHL